MRLQVELQAVAFVALGFYRDAAQAAELADLVKEHSSILGAIVCCAAHDGSQQDEQSVCNKERDILLDRCTNQHVNLGQHCSSSSNSETPR